jgi:hypothetical protein
MIVLASCITVGIRSNNTHAITSVGKMQAYVLHHFVFVSISLVHSMHGRFSWSFLDMVLSRHGPF